MVKHYCRNCEKEQKVKKIVIDNCYTGHTVWYCGECHSRSDYIYINPKHYDLREKAQNP